MIFIRHVQILGNDRCVLIVERPDGNISIFCERLSALDNAVRNERYKKLLHRDKIGQDVLLAFDEQKRMLAVCTPTKVRIAFPVFPTTPLIVDRCSAFLVPSVATAHLRLR
jgi:hypothetical protein